jgi:endonuclease/exonuclease/phosphatase family metal-dependent hydrolase
VRGSKPFKFVNTHLESFDDRTIVPSIRAQQAGELVGPGGPATGRLPVILVGDINSDVRTETAPGDGQAYRVLTGAGLRERSTYKPLNCCIDEGNFSLTSGSPSEFDHKVDHIMTDAPKKVKLLASGVTGRKMSNGYWDSDHAGLFSKLSILR